MPPLKSKVLVIFPGGIVDGAFVLCSGFDPLVESQTSELLTEDKDKEYLKINEIGWKKTYNKETGKLNIEGPSTDTNQIKLEVDRENSKIKLELGNYSILLDKTARKLEAIVESHTLKMDQNEQLIENSNGGKIKTDQTGSVIAETSSGTFKIDSSGNITFNNGTESYVLGTSFIAALKIYLNVESGITPGTTAQNAAALTAIQGAAAALLTAMGTNNDYLSQKIKGA